jgi:hypothetical protein
MRGRHDLETLKHEAGRRGYRVSVGGGVIGLERDGKTERFEQSLGGLEAAFEWLAPLKVWQEKR